MLNLRGRAYQVYDGAGVVTSQAYDFKGNVLQASRRLRSDVHADADWSVLAGLTDVSAIATAADPLLEIESFGTQTAYDALNRPTSVTAPDASEVKPTYNEAGLLERVEARIRGAVAWTTFVDDIDYDAKGQRERIDYGNGTFTEYTYDPLTYRLSRLKTTRSSDCTVLQNLRYVYDRDRTLTGNIHTSRKSSSRADIRKANQAMSDRGIEWALVQMIVSRTPVLPDWVRECAKVGCDAIVSLPVVDDAEAGDLARPGLELRSVSPDYLEFLREQIELNARGEEWTAILQRRLKALEPFEGQPVLTVMFHRKPESLTLRIDPRSETILGYEEY